MAANRQYDHEFKVQAIKLAQEIGQAKAAKELGISKNTMYTWTRAQRLGYLNGRYDTKKMTTEELKVLVWRYFMSYWKNRRICSTNGGLPPMVKRRQFYDSIAATS